MSTKITKLLCLGDSLTQAYGINESKCWVSLLAKSINIECINAGISGDTTTGMLGRLESLIKTHNPSHVIITGGTNDISFAVPINIILSNIHAITRQCKFSGAIPIIGVPLSVYSKGFNLEENQLISNSDFINQMEEFHIVLREFARLNEFMLIDFALHTGEEHLMNDGVHPNEFGHEKMMEIVKGSLFGMIE